MSNESRFCGNCGAPMAGQFCGACGHRASDQATASGEAVQDAPTRVVSGDRGEEPTSHRPSGDPRITDAEAGWYQSADASAGDAPYAGAYGGAAYDSAPYSSDYDQGQSHGASAYASGGYAPAPQPQRPNHTAAIAAGLVALLLVACLGGYLLMRGGGSKAATPGPSSLPRSSQPTSPSASSAPASSSPSSAQTAQQPAPTQAPNNSTTPPAVVPPTTQTPMSTPSDASSSTPGDTGSQAGGTGFAGLSDVHEQVTMNGSTYAVTQSGTSVAIYQDEGGSPTKLADITLPALPDYGHNPKSLELVALGGCSKPVLTFNSVATNGSGAFGWDGSGYEVYKSTGGDDLEPIASDTRSLGTLGVYVEDGAVVYKDSEGAEKHYFRSCSSASPDDLKWDH